MGGDRYCTGAFIDVGANIGIHSVLAALRVGALGRVLASEASPITFPLLAQNLGSSGCPGAVALNRGVWDVPTSMTFCHVPENPAHSHFTTTGHERGHLVPVTCEPLDSIVEQAGLNRVDLTHIVVLSQRDRNVLRTRYRLPAGRIDVIPLGVPDPPAGTPEEWKERLGLSGRTVAMTFGLMGPGKGLETAIAAVGRVAPSHPDLIYLIVGTIHPEVRRAGGDAYQAGLAAQAAGLGIGHQVRFIDRYLEEAELLRYLMATDIYITPYPQKGRGVSLTTLYAAALGKAIITTPFDYARELLVGRSAWMVPFQDPGAMAQALQVLVEQPHQRAILGAAARELTRDCTWLNAAHRYRALARALAAGRTRQL